MCLFAIEDRQDLEDFDRLDGLADVDTVLVAIPLVRGNLELGILWRAAYHELKALQALRRAGLSGCSRAREAALRDFLGFVRDAADALGESQLVEHADVVAPADDDHKPPGRHPPESSGRPARRTRDTYPYPKDTPWWSRWFFACGCAPHRFAGPGPLTAAPISISFRLAPLTG